MIGSVRCPRRIMFWRAGKIFLYARSPVAPKKTRASERVGLMSDAKHPAPDPFKVRRRGRGWGGPGGGADPGGGGGVVEVAGVRPAPPGGGEAAPRRKRDRPTGRRSPGTPGRRTSRRRRRRRPTSRSLVYGATGGV